MGRHVNFKVCKKSQNLQIYFLKNHGNVLEEIKKIKQLIKYFREKKT